MLLARMSQPANPLPRSEPFRVAITRRHRELCQIGTLNDCLTTDAVVICPNGDVLRGRNIAAHWLARRLSGLADAIQTQEWWPSGFDMVMEVGQIAEAGLSFSSIWQRGSDGEWRLLRSQWSGPVGDEAWALPHSRMALEQHAC